METPRKTQFSFRRCEIRVGESMNMRRSCELWATPGPRERMLIGAHCMLEKSAGASHYPHIPLSTCVAGLELRRVDVRQRPRLLTPARPRARPSLLSLKTQRVKWLLRPPR